MIPFYEDRLVEVLNLTTRRVALVPPNWDNVAEIISMGGPDQVDVTQFRNFQKLFFEKSGIALEVVGGAIGCLKIFIRAKEWEINGTPAEVGELLRVLQEDETMRDHLLGAMGSTVRVKDKNTTLDLKSNTEEPIGHGGHPLVVVNNHTMIVEHAGVVGPGAQVDSQTIESKALLAMDRKFCTAQLTAHPDILGIATDSCRLNFNEEKTMAKNSARQAGVVGDRAVVRNMTIQGIFPNEHAVPDISEMAHQLKELRSAMQQNASQPGQFVEMGNVAEAEIEADKKNWDGVLNALKRCGQWTLDVARDIGVNIASEVIKKTAGL